MLSWWSRHGLGVFGNRTSLRLAWHDRAQGEPCYGVPFLYEIPPLDPTS